MLRLVLKSCGTLKGFSSNAQLSSWRKNFSLSQVRTSLFRFMAVVSYPATVHLSKEPSLLFLVMPSLVLAGCSLLPLKPYLLQAEKPSPSASPQGASAPTPHHPGVPPLNSLRFTGLLSTGAGGATLGTVFQICLRNVEEEA